jgi:hypothetical protein
VDCLSHYYENKEGDNAQDEEINWANADVQLDPEGDDLPQDQWLELKSMMVEGETNPRKASNLQRNGKPIYKRHRKWPQPWKGRLRILLTLMWRRN